MYARYSSGCRARQRALRDAPLPGDTRGVSYVSYVSYGRRVSYGGCGWLTGAGSRATAAGCVVAGCRGSSQLTRSFEGQIFWNPRGGGVEAKGLQRATADAPRPAPLRPPEAPPRPAQPARTGAALGGSRREGRHGPTACWCGGLDDLIMSSRVSEWCC